MLFEIFFDVLSYCISKMQFNIFTLENHTILTVRGARQIHGMRFLLVQGTPILGQESSFGLR